MTNQPDSVMKLWNKYRHEGDENTPDRMFYENFVDAITEAIAEAEEDIDLLTEEMARLREDIENARAEERKRILNLPRYMFGKPNGDKIEMLQTIAVLDIEALTPTKTDNNKDV